MAVSKKRATQSDVARLAGVSRSTVSFVLNGSSSGQVPIGEETRQKVLAAAMALSYSPDPVARMLVTGRNNLVGVFTFESSFPFDRTDFYYEFLLGIEREAAAHDQNVVLFTRPSKEQEPKVFSGGDNSLRLADGALLLGVNPDRAELKRLVDDEYPFVFIGRREVAGCEIDWVASDYGPASQAATRHLLELGHTQLAFVAHEVETEANQDKLEGVRQAIAASPAAQLHRVAGDDLATADRLIARLKEGRCTAALCSHSATFDVVTAALSLHHLAVPGDVSVLSLADVSPSALRSYSPTYVNINRTEAGAMAVRQLMQRLRGEASRPKQTRIACELVRGKTTGPAPTPQ